MSINHKRVTGIFGLKGKRRVKGKEIRVSKKEQREKAINDEEGS